MVLVIKLLPSSICPTPSYGTRTKLTTAPAYNSPAKKPATRWFNASWLTRQEHLQPDRFSTFWGNQSCIRNRLLH